MEEKRGLLGPYWFDHLKNIFFLYLPLIPDEIKQDSNLEEKKKSQDFCILIFQRFKYPNISFLFSQFPSLECSALDNTKSEDFFLLAF